MRRGPSRGWAADVSCIWGHHGHSYQPYEDAEEFKYILEWAKTKRRDPWPRYVRYATWNLSWNRAYWVTLDRLADPLLAGQIDAEVKDGNRIEVKTWNLAAYHLALSDKSVDPKKNVTVVTDGKESYAGPFRERIDLELVKPPAAKFLKSADMPDEITAVTVGCSYSTKGFLAIPGRTWLAVKGTAADEATSKLLEKWWPKDAKADGDVADADRAGLVEGPGDGVLGDRMRFLGLRRGDPGQRERRENDMTDLHGVPRFSQISITSPPPNFPKPRPRHRVRRGHAIASSHRGPWHRP